MQKLVVLIIVIVAALLAVNYFMTGELTLIPGAQHMYYGSFDGGSYQEEWGPGIERDAMQRIVIDGLNEWLARNFPTS